MSNNTLVQSWKDLLQDMFRTTVARQGKFLDICFKILYLPLEFSLFSVELEYSCNMNMYFWLSACAGDIPLYISEIVNIAF